MYVDVDWRTPVYRIEGWRVKSGDEFNPNGLQEEADRTLKLPRVPILRFPPPVGPRLAAIAVAKVTPLRDRTVKTDRDTRKLSNER